MILSTTTSLLQTSPLAIAIGTASGDPTASFGAFLIDAGAAPVDGALAPAVPAVTLPSTPGKRSLAPATLPGDMPAVAAITATVPIDPAADARQIDAAPGIPLPVISDAAAAITPLGKPRPAPAGSLPSFPGAGWKAPDIVPAKEAVAPPLVTPRGSATAAALPQQFGSVPATVEHDEEPVEPSDWDNDGPAAAEPMVADAATVLGPVPVVALTANVPNAAVLKAHDTAVPPTAYVPSAKLDLTGLPTSPVALPGSSATVAGSAGRPTAPTGKLAVGSQIGTANPLLGSPPTVADSAGRPIAPTGKLVVGSDIGTANPQPGVIDTTGAPTRMTRVQVPSPTKAAALTIAAEFSPAAALGLTRLPLTPSLVSRSLPDAAIPAAPVSAMTIERVADPLAASLARTPSAVHAILPDTGVSKPAVTTILGQPSASTPVSGAAVVAEIAAALLPVPSAEAAPGSISASPAAAAATAITTALPNSAPAQVVSAAGVDATVARADRAVAGDLPQTTAAPLPQSGPQQPAAPLLQGPALQVFGAALAAARRDERTPTDAHTLDATTLQPATDAVRTVAATADAQQAPLDVSQQRWPHAMVDRIVHLRDTAAAIAASAVDTKIRLVPDALGSIDISITRHGDSVAVHFQAEHAATRALLQESQGSLAEIADSRGLRLSGSSVDAGAANTGQQQQHAERQPTPQPLPGAPPRAAATDPAATDDLGRGRVA
jgi:flagellar hook-length control protein FliK